MISLTYNNEYLDIDHVPDVLEILRAQIKEKDAELEELQAEHSRLTGKRFNWFK